ncbi:MAG: ABC transporter substrate-binding protein [Microbacteriaceae bacterium]|nr:ABC transporter substrate-binding protein [Microbacteriaceae bacterium]
MSAAPGLSRRALLRALVAGGALTGATALAGAAVARSQASPALGGAPLRVGYLPITDAAPLLVAHHRGLYEQYGVPVAQPVLFRSWSSLAEAFLAGRVDVIHLLMPLAVQLRFGFEADARVIAWNHVNGSALTVAPEVDDLAQLAGTSVGIPAWWSIHNVITQRMLRAEGLTPVFRADPVAARGEVNLVPMPPADMVPALGAGSISGFAVADPFGAMAEVTGAGRTHRFLGDVWRDHACCATVVRGDVLRGRPEAVAALTAALVEAELHCDGHRHDAAASLSDGYLPQPEGAVRLALTRGPESPVTVRAHPEWHGERLGFAPVPQAGYTALLVEEMRTTLADAPNGFLRGLDGERAHRELVDPAPLDALPAALAARIDRTPRTEELA